MEKNIINITDIVAFRAATVCTSKEDIRDYLTGVMIDSGSDTITGSDGHTLFHADAVDCTEFNPKINEVSKTPIIKLDLAIPVNALSGYIDFDRNMVIISCGSGGRTEKRIPFTIINTKYPDFQKTIDIKPVVCPIEDVDINTKYLARAEKTVKAASTRLVFHGEGATVTYARMYFRGSALTCQAYIALVMAMR